jgi:hypothetical protein
METKHQLSNGVIVAIIGGLFAVVAAVIGACITVVGPFLFRSTEKTPIPIDTAYIREVPTKTATNIPPVINTIESLPTETISYTIQPVGYEFFDDFEFGLSDQWEIQYGQLGMVDGKLTVTAPSKGTQTYHYIVLDDLYWGDMTIEVELAPFDGIHYGCDANGAGEIILHQGLDSQAAGFMYCARYEGVQLGTFIDDGEWSILPGSYVSGWPQNFSFHGGWHTIKIVSKGGTYVAYIDNKKITSATIPGSKIGAVGLWFRTHTSDSPELYSPRIESIKIVSNAP